MQGFESDKWNVYKYSSHVEIRHKKYPFIRIRGIKKAYRTSEYQSKAQTHWSFYILGWHGIGNSFQIEGKLLTSKIPGIFDELIKYDNSWAAIFSYLFNGAWK